MMELEEDTHKRRTQRISKEFRNFSCTGGPSSKDAFSFPRDRLRLIIVYILNVYWLKVHSPKM